MNNKTIGWGLMILGGLIVLIALGLTIKWQPVLCSVIIVGAIMGFVGYLMRK